MSDRVQEIREIWESGAFLRNTQIRVLFDEIDQLRDKVNLQENEIAEMQEEIRYLDKKVKEG